MNEKSYHRDTLEYWERFTEVIQHASDRLEDSIGYIPPWIKEAWNGAREIIRRTEKELFEIEKSEVTSK